MTIIADAGSTKIEWALIGKEKGCSLRLCTRGFNAAQSPACNLATLMAEDAPEFVARGRGARAVYFYGAGCIGERCGEVADVLRRLFRADEAHVDSDMLAAARALCGDRPGIACILGTGSNSCLYDGRQITCNVPPMGFILGDEGSGAALGKALLTMVFKEQLPAETVRLFNERFPEADKAEVIAKVYRGGRPGAYLASFAPFLKEHISRPEINAIVRDEFLRFFRMNILAYPGAGQLPVNFIGSIARHFEPQLRDAATACGLTVGLISQAPMDALISYHAE